MRNETFYWDGQIPLDIPSLSGPLHQTGLAHALFPLKVFVVLLYEKVGWPTCRDLGSKQPGYQQANTTDFLEASNDPKQLQTVTGQAHLI